MNKQIYIPDYLKEPLAELAAALAERGKSFSGSLLPAIEALLNEHGIEHKKPFTD